MRDDDYTADERRLFEALPRESEVDAREEERVAARLRAEGFFVTSRFSRKALLAAAAAVIFVAGIFIGSAIARPEITGSACADLPGAIPSSADPAGKEPVRTAGVLWF